MKLLFVHFWSGRLPPIYGAAREVALKTHAHLMEKRLSNKLGSLEGLSKILSSGPPSAACSSASVCLALLPEAAPVDFSARVACPSLNLDFKCPKTSIMDINSDLARLSLHPKWSLFAACADVQFSHDGESRSLTIKNTLGQVSVAVHCIVYCVPAETATRPQFAPQRICERHCQCS
jgi:hypothetical protein